MDWLNIPKVKCISCHKSIEPCITGFRINNWKEDGNHGNEDKREGNDQDGPALAKQSSVSLDPMLNPDFENPPKVYVWKDLCSACVTHDLTRRNMMGQSKLKLPIFVDLIDLPLPHGVKYKKRKKTFKSRRQKEKEAASTGVKEKKLNALDILDQNRLPSPKDLKYLCMLKIVNGAYLYINEGRQWEGERIHALKNISKVESDIAAARVEESSSRDMLKECMDKQEKISRLLIVNEDSISRNRKQLEEIKDLHARTEKNIYSSSTALQSYIRSNNLRKADSEKDKLAGLMEISERLSMTMSELVEWVEYIDTLKMKYQREIRELHEEKFKLEDVLHEKMDAVDALGFKLNRCIAKGNEPLMKLKQCFHPAQLHKGILDPYMHEQILEHIVLRGKLQDQVAMDVIKSIAVSPGPHLSLSEKHLGANEVRLLSYFLHAQKISSLCLSFNKLRGEDLDDLMNETRVNHTLTHLDLSFNKLGPDGARFICKTLAVGQGALVSLNLSGNKLGAEGAKALGTALMDRCNLTSLNLFQNYVEIEGARALSEALKVNNKVRILNLRYNGLYPAGATLLADMMKVNTSLTEINITDNHIGPEGAAEIARYMRGTMGSLLRSVGYDIKAKSR